MRSFFGIAFAMWAISAGPAVAQAAPSDLAGTYNGGQMEVGTGLLLKPDGRFEYYLSYGALDEMARGTWAADGDAIVLTSDPVAAPEFELLGTETGSGRDVAVSLEVPGGLPLGLFAALLLRPDGTASEVHFDEHGLRVAMSPANRPKAIMLGLPLYEVRSEPFDIPPGAKAMHFRFVANDLGTVAFNHQRLARDGDAFVLQRFGRTLRFRKEAPEEEGEAEPTDGE